MLQDSLYVAVLPLSSHSSVVVNFKKYIALTHLCPSLCSIDEVAPFMVCRFTGKIDIYPGGCGNLLRWNGNSFSDIEGIAAEVLSVETAVNSQCLAEFSRSPGKICR